MSIMTMHSSEWVSETSSFAMTSSIFLENIRFEILYKSTDTVIWLH